MALEKSGLNLASKKDLLLIDKHLCLDYLSSTKILSLINKRLDFVFEKSFIELKKEIASNRDTVKDLKTYLLKPKYFHLTDSYDLVKRRLEKRSRSIASE